MDKRCPRRLKKLPVCVCNEGKKGINAARQGKVGGCPWFVSEAESNFCFFKYMADEGHAIPTSRIARLVMIDDNEVKRVIQSFKRKIRQHFGIDQNGDF